MVHQWSPGRLAAAGTSDEGTGLEELGVDVEEELAVGKDELTRVVAKTEDVSGSVDEVLGVEEDPVTTAGRGPEEPEIVDDDDGEGMREDARVDVEAVVGTVDKDGGVEDEIDEEREGVVVAASDGGAELELGLEVEVEVGEVDEDGTVELDSSLAVDEAAFPPSAGVKEELDVVGAVEDGDSVEDASTVEDVRSHVGVTGMTVNPPSSSSSPLSFWRAAGAPDTIEVVDDTAFVASGTLDETASWPGASERAIGPAEQDHAKAKRAV
ncbi:uncharacterized protein N7496_009996 [Penicillium cataractarum]|uniref:Uncharacterized protein n=1 Tax=Penicillium cataractarum TaxID=2100454 RepID=A0A9W9V0G4_9EURO|nr:uncharacterized protein N7496_009996 [Penicillium cataractarum]KAJ5364283.1 hypothetical protein N7496_009996 [Penicillium cataractarum]